jgi:hypothetical protein
LKEIAPQGCALTISAVAGTGAAELLPPPIKVNKGFKLPAAV